MKKFTMELVWHNCEECPPSECFNDNLYITNGRSVYKAIYEEEVGWVLGTPFAAHSAYELSYHSLKDFWWADIEQTVQGEPRFKI